MNPTVLLTSGGTKIKIDMVRSITNMSNGTFGSKIADAFLDKDCNLTFLHAKDSKLPYASCLHYNAVQYVTFDDYAARLDEELQKQPNIIVLAAAVSDYGVANYVDGKIRSNDNLIIQLTPLPKLISRVREKCPNSIICGFKLLVNSTEHELIQAATTSLINNNLDLVIGNDLRDIKNSNHTLHVVKRKENIFSSEYVVEKYNSCYNLPKVVVDACMNQYRNH
jgi:phosphopantothenoylcysteine synthetase/decarboxylase